MDLGLETRPEGDELGPVADQFPQFPHLGRGDPRLGQTTEAQQVGEIPGVALVVLHSPVPPVVPQGMGQVQPAAALLQHVRGPVPAVASLQDDLRVRAGLGQLQAQRHRIVLDTDHLEFLALRGHPHDHAAAAVQINPDVLSFL